VEDLLIDVYKAGLTVAWPLAIGALLGVATAYYISRQLSKDREQLRTLRVSLERDPSPGQIGSGLRMWPDVARFPANLQVQEMIKRASQDENRRAERVEVTLSVTRFIACLAFIGIALAVAGMFWVPA
jgi:hypothetical protein